MTYVRIILLILCAVLTGVAQPPQSPPASAKRLVPLQVKVTEASSPRPRQDVELFLEDINWKHVAGPIKPDASGKVEFRVPPGHYLVGAVDKDGEHTYHNQLPEGSVNTVSIAPEDKAVSVVFPMAVLASLSGFVRDDFGEPVQRVRVELMRALWQNGNIAFQSSYSGETDDQGRYRIANVTPGSYILCGNPSQQQQAPEAGPVDFAQKPRIRYYQRTCIPAEPRSSSPAPALRILEGSAATGDLVLHAAPTATISGRVTTSSEFEHANLRLIADSVLQDPPEFYLSTYPNNPAFTFTAIPHGSYRLYAEALTKDGKQTLYASVSAEAGETDLEGLAIALEPAASVELDWDDPALANGVSTVSLVPLDRRQHEIMLTVDPGSKRPLQKFPPLRPGSYWLRTRTNDREPRVCIAGAKLGDSDVYRSPLIVTAGMEARLRLALTKDCARMDLRTVSKGKPAPGVRAVILLRGTPENPGDCWTWFSDSNAKLSLSSIMPGKYLVWAWRDDRTGLVSDPPDLASIAKFAQTVEVKRGEPVTIDIELFDWLADWKERSSKQ